MLSSLQPILQPVKDIFSGMGLNIPDILALLLLLVVGCIAIAVVLAVLAYIIKAYRKGVRRASWKELFWLLGWIMALCLSANMAEPNMISNMLPVTGIKVEMELLGSAVVLDVDHLLGILLPCILAGVLALIIYSVFNIIYRAKVVRVREDVDVKDVSSNVLYKTYRKGYDARYALASDDAIDAMESRTSYRKSGGVGNMVDGVFGVIVALVRVVLWVVNVAAIALLIVNPTAGADGMLGMELADMNYNFKDMIGLNFTLFTILFCFVMTGIMVRKAVGGCEKGFFEALRRLFVIIFAILGPVLFVLPVAWPLFADVLAGVGVDVAFIGEEFLTPMTNFISVDLLQNMVGLTDPIPATVINLIVGLIFLLLTVLISAVINWAFKSLSNAMFSNSVSHYIDGLLGGILYIVVGVILAVLLVVLITFLQPVVAYVLNLAGVAL